MKEFREFYQNMGFEKYPFFEKTAEKEDTTSLFIAPPGYSILNDVFDSKETAIISGSRGSGKTIILFDIKDRTPSNNIETYVSNYESIPLKNNILEFYSLILQHVIIEVSRCLSENKNALKNLDKADKLLLSFLIMKYAESITNSEITTQIENVQLNWVKKFLNRLSKPLVAFLNYGTMVVANFGSEVLNRRLGGYLPPIDDVAIRQIIPDIKFDVTSDFKSVNISYALFDRALKLVRKMFHASPIVMLDKFDEDRRLESDASLVVEFIKELLCDNNILLNENIQLFISVWEIPFQNLSSIFRESKHTVFSICWSLSELENVLNRRLSVYSGGKVNDYRKIFSQDVSQELFQQLFALSNMNPRDLWDIFNSIFSEQHEIDNEIKSLSAMAVKKGLISFVKNFKYYEHYPRSKNARRDSNDVFSYIQHLLKLSGTDEFTESDLRKAASTGGSTPNYIASMVNIGLVKKTDKKGNRGAVVYKVNDPKISFAILEKIDISH